MTTHSLIAGGTGRLTSYRILLMWLGFAAVLLLAPHVFTSSLAHSHLTQMGTGIVLALSYNILLGQSGMLSFGHAAFWGLGAFMSVHAMNLAGAGPFWLPVPVMPVL